MDGQPVTLIISGFVVLLIVVVALCCIAVHDANTNQHED